MHALTEPPKLKRNVMVLPMSLRVLFLKTNLDGICRSSRSFKPTSHTQRSTTKSPSHPQMNCRCAFNPFRLYKSVNLKMDDRIRQYHTEATAFVSASTTGTSLAPSPNAVKAMNGFRKFIFKVGAIFEWTLCQTPVFL